MGVGTRERFESVFPPDAVVGMVLDTDGTVLDIFGADRSDGLVDLRGCELSEFLPAEVAERYRACIQTVVERNEPAVLEFDVDRDDHTQWFEGTVSPYHPADENRETVLCLTRDISERKYRATDLQAVNRNLTELYEATSLLYRAETREECYEIVIDTAVEILGLDWCSLVAPAEDADVFVIKAISEDGTVEVGHRAFETDEGIAGHVYATKESHVIDDVNRSDRANPTNERIRSGLTVPVGDWGIFHAFSGSKGAFDDHDRRLTELLSGALATEIDRTDRERDLAMQNERLDAFTRIVSHDLRNPLNTARGFLELASEETDSEYLGRTEQALAHMERLIDDTLALAKQGDTISETEAVPLREVVNEAWTNHATRDASVTVEEDFTIPGDRVRLRQVFENLFDNAIRHGEEPVGVTVGPLEGAGLFVEDDGPGIPPDRRDGAFEPGKTTAGGGTGFGLAIVKEIVQAHGWEIAITKGRSGGARFEITGLPE